MTYVVVTDQLGTMITVLFWEIEECHCSLQVEVLWCHRWRLCCSGFSPEIKTLTPEISGSDWE